MAKVQASNGTRTVTSRTVWAKKTTPLTIPVRDIDTLENIACGFRMDIVEANDSNGKKVGGVSAGPGLGNLWILVDWKGKEVAIHALDLLRVHVERVAPEDLEKFDKDVKRALALPDDDA